MQAEIITIGTEILLGQIVDTNAAKLATMLKGIGVDLYYKTTVGDNHGRIVEVFNNALNRVDVVITSGGLGPTADDITRQAVADVTGRPLRYSSVLEAEIAERFRSFGRNMAENNKQQAYIPEGATPLSNPVGTAPCFLAEDISGRGCIISLPGVPRELEYMMIHTVIPLLIERMGGAKLLKTRILKTAAVGESNVDQAIRDLMDSANPTVGLAAHGGQTDIRIVAKADTEAEITALIAPMEAKLRERLGVAIFGADDDTLAGVVGQLLVEQNATINVVDMLTQGRVKAWFVEAGHENCITDYLMPDSVQIVAQTMKLDIMVAPNLFAEHVAMAKQHAEPKKQFSLALIGPFEDSSTIIAIATPTGQVYSWPSRFYQNSDYVKRWLTFLGLDWLRRVLLGQLRSPVDWVDNV
ncbi:CinA family nicotinamide mononucleotide deamidase-related protein [Anaerolineales bacterium HSG6]|nr:CinA family nicotinamide mononucleotide deamidase-related protein [Anaerolineales bacterium HSG6]